MATARVKPHGHDRRKVDVEITFDGSLFLFRPLTRAARGHFDEIKDAGGEHTWWCGGLVVEHGYARGFALTLAEEGFVVR